jgi:hypothetical protein
MSPPAMPRSKILRSALTRVVVAARACFCGISTRPIQALADGDGLEFRGSELRPTFEQSCNDLALIIDRTRFQTNFALDVGKINRGRFAEAGITAFESGMGKSSFADLSQSSGNLVSATVN